MRVVEVGMSYCPSFSDIDVVESQEDMDIKGNESRLCTMARILVTIIILFNKSNHCSTLHQTNTTNLRN